MRSSVRRMCTRLGAVAIATALAVGIAQPASAGWVPYGFYDYYSECQAIGQGREGTEWVFWYCVMLPGGNGYAQLMVFMPDEV